MKHLALALSLLAAPVSAQTGPPQTQALQTGLRGGWAMENGNQMAGLQMQIAPGWHTYWRAPGDAGIPPAFDWSGSENVRSVRIHWPRPRAFQIGGETTIGYQGNLILPLEVTPKDASRPIHLRGAVDVGVCDEICVPAAFKVDADLPRPGADDTAIHTALRQRPFTASEAGVAGIVCTVTPTPDGLRLTARMTLPDTGGREIVAVELGQPGLYASAADPVRKGGRLTATADITSYSGGPVTLTRSAVVLTVLGDRRAVEIRGCPAA